MPDVPGMVRKDPLRRSGHDDVDALALPVKKDRAVGEREKSVVASAFYIEPGREFRASLPDDNRTGGDALTAVAFDAQSF